MANTVTKTVKLPQRTVAALRRAAKSRGCSESELIREGIDLVTCEDGGIDMAAAFGRALGVARGPGDLSSDRRHLVGYGRARDR